MPATLIAHTRAAESSPLRAYSITLRTAGQRLAFTAIARSSGEALCNALYLPEVVLPVCASVKLARAE